MKEPVEKLCLKSKKRKRKSSIFLTSKKRLKHKHYPLLITTHKECCFCKEGQNKDLGTFFFNETANLAAHQYCLLFSAGLPQLGEDDEGFDGFLFDDVVKEANRAHKIDCKLCNSAGASAGCSVKSCRSLYHFKCGLQHGAQFIFADAFDSYCTAHRSFQDLSAINKMVTLPKCPICLEEIMNADHNSIMKTPCCINVYIHRICMQYQADVSGYFFRCPTCNDDKMFTDEMAKYGIYVPLRDAAWEATNAYADLLEQYSKCDMKKCHCRRGRSYNTQSGKWNILRCYACGQSGVHVHCLGNFYIPGFGYVCSDCNSVICKSKPRQFMTIQKNYQDRWMEHKRLLQKLTASNDPVLLASPVHANRIWLKRFDVKPCHVLLEKIDPSKKNRAEKRQTKNSQRGRPDILEEPLSSSLLTSSKVPSGKYIVPLLHEAQTTVLKTQTQQNSAQQELSEERLFSEPFTQILDKTKDVVVQEHGVAKIIDLYSIKENEQTNMSPSTWSTIIDNINCSDNPQYTSSVPSKGSDSIERSLLSDAADIISSAVSHLQKDDQLTLSEKEPSETSPEFCEEKIEVDKEIKWDSTGSEEFIDPVTRLLTLSEKEPSEMSSEFCEEKIEVDKEIKWNSTGSEEFIDPVTRLLTLSEKEPSEMSPEFCEEKIEVNKEIKWDSTGGEEFIDPVTRLLTLSEKEPSEMSSEFCEEKIEVDKEIKWNSTGSEEFIDPVTRLLTGTSGHSTCGESASGDDEVVACLSDLIEKTVLAVEGLVESDTQNVTEVNSAVKVVRTRSYFRRHGLVIESPFEAKSMTDEESSDDESDDEDSVNSEEEYMVDINTAPPYNLFVPPRKNRLLCVSKLNCHLMNRYHIRKNDWVHCKLKLAVINNTPIHLRLEP